MSKTLNGSMAKQLVDAIVHDKVSFLSSSYYTKRRDNLLISAFV